MIHGQKNDTVHGWTTSTWIGRKAARARQKKGKLMHVRGGAEQLYTRARGTGAIKVYHQDAALAHHRLATCGASERRIKLDNKIQLT